MFVYLVVKMRVLSLVFFSLIWYYYGRKEMGMLEIILDTLIDAVKIIPFLWLAFFIIELLEHKFQHQSQMIVKKSGRLGPLLGGILGCFPQCGFSVMATNLYVTRIITLGTLISVYLSTSDEMLPILLATGSSFGVILKILLVKLGIGIVSGFFIDFFFPSKELPNTYELCEQEHCHCEKGVIVSSLKHTFHTLIFLMGVSFFLNIVMEYGGKDWLVHHFQSRSLLTPFLASLIGLIPNCGASVVLTELYLSEVISFPSVIAGLLTGSGVSMLVLFRTNKNFKENLKVLLLVYLIGVFSGIILEILSFI